MNKYLKQILKDPNTYEFRLITLLSGLLIFVLLAGGVIFYQLNKIAYTVKLDRSENRSLLFIKDIQSQLIVANNAVNSYGLLRDSELLEQYRTSKALLYKKIDILENLQGLESKEKDQISEINPLIREKFMVLDSVLVVQNESRVNDALNKVLAQVTSAESKERFNTIPKPKDTKTLKERLFGKGNSKPSPVNQDLNKLNQEILSIREEETQKEQSSNSMLFVLQERNSSINLNILKKLNLLETNILGQLEREGTKASKSSKTISYFLILFSLSVSALIGITIFSIFRYIQINRQTKLALQLAKKRSDDLADSKARFLANMSHEIRTPLNAISGFANLLSKEKNLPEKQKEKITIIQQSSDHLSSLINQILDLAKLQSNKMNVELTSFNLYEEINWVTNVVQSDSVNRGNRIILNIADSVPEYLEGDPMKLKQILLNLTSNAVKFTQNGTIEIDIQSLVTSNEKIELRIRVKDSGIGIPPEKQTTIFDEFEQAEKSTTRQFGGTGLGLAITKKLLDVLEGKIYLHSEMGKGTTITIHIPVMLGYKKTIKKTQSLSNKLTPHVAGKNVLVVDDEPFNRKLLVTLLNQHSVFTAEASNGKEALEKISQEKFDIVFMDIRMPLMDGKETTLAVRNELKMSKDDLIIIALTANTQLIDEQEYAEIGFNSYMEKPFTEDKIMELFSEEVQQTNRSMETTDQLFDLKNLRQLSLDDEEFFKEMIISFMSTTQQGVAEMKVAFAEKNLKKVSDLAHKLASPCSHLEAKRMHLLLRDIEMNKDLNEISILISELAIVTEEMITQMQSLTGITLNI